MSNYFASSPEVPALTLFRYKLLAAFRTPDGTNDSKVASSVDEWDWTVTSVTHHYKSAGVGITVFKDKLWMCFRANEYGPERETYFLYLAWSDDGKNWSFKYWYECKTYLEGPTMSVLKYQLFVAFKRS